MHKEHARDNTFLASMPVPPWTALTAADVMTPHVETVPLDWSMERLATFLTDHQISGAPVVDESGQLCGMVSLTDIVRQTGSGLLDINGHGRDYRDSCDSLNEHVLSREDMHAFHEDLEQTVMVADIMTPVVFQVDENQPLEEVASAMVKGHIHRVLVTDGKKPKGIVSALDLLAIHC